MFFISGIFTTAAVRSVGLPVIDCTDHGGRWHGYISGPSAATADSFYA